MSPPPGWTRAAGSTPGTWSHGLVADGTTVLLTTQYLEEADRLADHIAVINHGRVIAEGTATELKQSAGSERIDVVMRHAADLPAAAAVLARAAGPGPGPNRIRRTSAFPWPLPAATGCWSKVLSELDAQSLPVDEASLRRPTLDDVFLQLTGRRGGRPAAPAAGPGTPEKAEALA